MQLKKRLLGGFVALTSVIVLATLIPGLISVRRGHLERVSPRFTSRVPSPNRRSRALCHDKPSISSLTHKKSWNILVNDKHKFMYCYVPKVACTNWKWVMLRLQGNTELEAGNKLVHWTKIPRLNEFSADEINKKLKSYFKFVFVRDPLKRLVSGYRDKFMKRSVDFQHVYGKLIAKKYRSNANATGNGSDITFTEFLRYVGDSDINSMNEHWKPISKLCNFCDIEYNFVGSFEHLSEDTEKVLRLLNLSQVISFPGKQKRYDRYNPEQLINEVPKDVLGRALDKYHTDYKLFSYSKPISTR